MSRGGAARSRGMPSLTDAGEREFAHQVNRHRRELHVHCYRMLGSFDEAEDLVQETFLRAWRHRESFEGGSGLRAWLYRIATNTCLDAIRRKGRRVEEVSSFAEIPWLQPYPDRLLDEVAPRADEPDAVVVARETIELGFLALIQLLPARQRAVLILRDVLEFSAVEAAEALETSVASVKSALRRPVPSGAATPSSPRRSESCCAASSRRTRAATTRPPSGSWLRTSASPCRPRRWSTTASPRCARCSRGPSSLTTSATGSCSRRG